MYGSGSDRARQFFVSTSGSRDYGAASAERGVHGRHYYY